MKIREGAYYRARGGQVFGPMVRDEDYNANFPWCLIFGGNRWGEDGQWNLNGREDSFDLVAEVYISATPPAPRVNTTKTARDELVEKAALEIFKRFYLTPASEVGFDWMWRAAENFVEARKK